MKRFAVLTLMMAVCLAACGGPGASPTPEVEGTPRFILNPTPTGTQVSLEGVDELPDLILVPWTGTSGGSKRGHREMLLHSGVPVLQEDMSTENRKVYFSPKVSVSLEPGTVEKLGWFFLGWLPEGESRNSRAKHIIYVFDEDTAAFDVVQNHVGEWSEQTKNYTVTFINLFYVENELWLYHCLAQGVCLSEVEYSSTADGNCNVASRNFAVGVHVKPGEDPEQIVESITMTYVLGELADFVFQPEPFLAGCSLNLNGFDCSPYE